MVHILAKFGDDWLKTFLVIAEETDRQTNKLEHRAKHDHLAKISANPWQMQWQSKLSWSECCGTHLPYTKTIYLRIGKLF